MNDALNASWQYRKLSCFRCCEYLINYFTFIDVEQRSDDDIHYIKESSILPYITIFESTYFLVLLRMSSLIFFFIADSATKQQLSLVAFKKRARAAGTIL